MLNKDPSKDSITLKELQLIFKAISAEHKKKPDTPQLNIFFFACHGIDKNANQHIVLNDFDKNAKFYALHPSEVMIRCLSEQRKNGYFISIFACCREFFKADFHTGCMGASSREEALIKFNER